MNWPRQRLKTYVRRLKPLSISKIITEYLSNKTDFKGAISYIANHLLLAEKTYYHYSFSDQYIKLANKMTPEEQRIMNQKIGQYLKTHKAFMDRLIRPYIDSTQRVTHSWVPERITKGELESLFKYACFKAYIKFRVDPTTDAGRFSRGVQKIFIQDVLSEVRRERSPIRNVNQIVTDVVDTSEEDKINNLEVNLARARKASQFGIRASDISLDIRTKHIRRDFRKFLEDYIDRHIKRNKDILKVKILEIYDFISDINSPEYQRYAKKYLASRGYSEGSKIAKTPIIRAKFRLSTNKTKDYYNLIKAAYEEFLKVNHAKIMAGS